MQDVKIIDIDNEQWNMKDQEARNKIANLEILVNKLKEETEVIELNDIVLNPAAAFSGTVIKRGKIVTISGAIILRNYTSGSIISNLPINKSISNKDTVVVWTNYNGDFLGQSILSFDINSTDLSIGVGVPTSNLVVGEVSFSYVTE